MTSAPIYPGEIPWRSTFLRELLARMHGDATDIHVLGDLSRRFPDFREDPQEFFHPDEGRKLYYPLRVRPIQFLGHEKNQKHRAVVTYRDHDEDETIALLRKAKLNVRKTNPKRDPKNIFFDLETMFCRIVLDPMETSHARSYLTNLRRIEAGYSGKTVDDSALKAETRVLDDLIQRFTPGRGSILNTPLMLYFVGDLGAETLKHASTPATLYDAVVKKLLDRERDRPWQTLDPRNVRIAMGRLALAILANGRTHLALSEETPDEAFRTLDRFFSASDDTAHLLKKPCVDGLKKRWIDRYWVNGIYTRLPIEMPSGRSSSKDHSERIFVRWSSQEFAFAHDSYLYYFAACVLRCPKDPLRESGANILDENWRKAVVRWWGQDPELWKETAEFLGGMLSSQQVHDLALDLIVASTGPGWPELARRLIRGHGAIPETSFLQVVANAIDIRGALQPGDDLPIEGGDPRRQNGQPPEALFSEVYHFLRDRMAGDVRGEMAATLSERRQEPWICTDPVTSPTHWPPETFLHPSGIHDFVLDGGNLVFVDLDRKWWQRDRERVLNCIATAPEGSNRFAISGDGTTLVGSVRSIDEKRKVEYDQVWRIRADGVPDSLFRHDEGSRLLAVSRDGTVVVSSGKQRTIYRWVDDSANSSRPNIAHSHRLPGTSADEITAIATNAEGTIVVSGGFNGDVCRSEYGANGLIESIKLYSHQHSVTSITLTRDGRTVASGDSVGNVFRLGPTRENLQKVYNHRGEMISSIAMCDLGKVIVTGGHPSVFRFDLDVDREPNHIHDHSSQVLAISVSDNGETVVSTDDQGVVLRADGRTRNPVLSRHRNAVSAIVMSDDGGLIFTGGEDGSVHRASPTGIEPWRSGHHYSPVRRLALGRDGRFLLVYHADGKVCKLTEGVEKPTTLDCCDPKADLAAVRGDGKVVAYLGEDGAIRRVEFGDESPRIVHKPSEVAAILPDASHRHRGLKDRLRQVAGSEAIDFQGGLDPADRDGEFFATTSDGSIRLMRREPMREDAEVTAFLCRQEVTALAIAPDHSFLVAGLSNGQVLHLWIMQPSRD